jgi:TetR/AcrR family transcriptional repressor of nem operon
MSYPGASMNDSASGELRPDADVVWLASSTLASVQGGLVLSQARRDPLALRRALDGALELIASYRPI